MANPEGVMIQEGKTNPVEAKPTLADLADAGLNDSEIKMAEEQKLVQSSEPDDKTKPQDDQVQEPKEEPKEPDISKRADVQEAFSDPEKEAELIENFNKNEKGLYWKMKKENARRQAAESERDHVLLKLKVAEEKTARLEAEAQASKTQPKKAADSEEPKVDVFGNPLPAEPDADKPVTKKDLEAMQKADAVKRDKEIADQSEKQARAEKLTSILNAQEADAKARYEDFEPAVQLAVELMKNAQNLDTVFPDARTQSRARKLLTDFFYATANADKFKDGDYNAADVAYELGKLHPKFGTPNGSGKSSDKNGDMDPEKAKKAIQNAGKRGSSAALGGGGGKKFVPYEEMNADQLAALSPSEFSKVPRDIRQRILAEV